MTAPRTGGLWSLRRAMPTRVAPVVLWCVAVLLGACAEAGRSEATEDPATERATATVVRRDLVARDEHQGSLGYGGAVPLVASTDGTVTSLPEEGTVIARGEVVAEIDGVPVRLLYGERPAWRRLTVTGGASEHGPDVRQLNDNLAALGYADREELPDERFDWRTRDAVRRWQGAVDRPATGALDLGEVTFAPGPIRIGSLASHRGARVGAGEVLASVTSTEQLVTVDLEVADRVTVGEGRPVVVVLPDRTEVAATVRSIGGVASMPEGPDERPTVPVIIAFDAELPGSIHLDAAPVTVQVERVLAEDVLVVPVGALVARPGGGYAVEQVVPGGGTEEVAVRPGAFAAGSVAVAGGLAAGDVVVVPS